MVWWYVEYWETVLPDHDRVLVRLRAEVQATMGRGLRAQRKRKRGDDDEEDRWGGLRLGEGHGDVQGEEGHEGGQGKEKREDESDGAEGRAC